MQGRCMKCKEQRDIKDAEIHMTSKGGFMVKGKCPVCGTGVCKIISKADAEKAIQEGIVKKAY